MSPAPRGALDLEEVFGLVRAEEALDDGQQRVDAPLRRRLLELPRGADHRGREQHELGLHLSSPTRTEWSEAWTSALVLNVISPLEAQHSQESAGA